MTGLLSITQDQNEVCRRRVAARGQATADLQQLLKDLSAAAGRVWTREDDARVEQIVDDLVTASLG